MGGRAGTALLLVWQQWHILLRASAAATVVAAAAARASTVLGGELSCVLCGVAASTHHVNPLLLLHAVALPCPSPTNTGVLLLLLPWLILSNSALCCRCLGL
jgi:hypothetical protein